MPRNVLGSIFMHACADRILAGDLRALARAATDVENRTPESEQILKALFSHTGNALTLGITGAPGAGKSTFVDGLIRQLRTEGRTVGVIAVDPSSPFTGGAILGDRIRMQEHHADDGVFIRSMATRGTMGGLASATMDMALLFDAAGRDVVLIETVGVGQDEVEVARLADVTMVILVPGMGDDVQAIKAGIMEIADVFIVNKADQPGAEKLQREILAMLSLAHRNDNWVPPVISAVAKEGKGIAEALAAARAYLQFEGRRGSIRGRWNLRLKQMLRERLLDRFEEHDFEEAAAQVAARTRDPYSIIDDWLKRI